jgi:predicted phage baseplate assembly protein
MGMPIPDLDDKTFAQLVEEACALIPRHAPQWTDHNIHDPGITFIDLFAWLAEMMIYRLNRVTAAHYKKFLQLLGIYPFDARHSRVDITFDNVYSEKTIKTGTQTFVK